jgi:hypothetical protein
LDVSPHAGVARLARAADPFSGARKRGKKMLASRMGKKQGCGKYYKARSVYARCGGLDELGVCFGVCFGLVEGLEGFVRSYLAESHTILFIVTVYFVVYFTAEYSFSFLET